MPAPPERKGLDQQDIGIAAGKGRKERAPAQITMMIIKRCPVSQTQIAKSPGSGFQRRQLHNMSGRKIKPLDGYAAAGNRHIDAFVAHGACQTGSAHHMADAQQVLHEEENPHHHH